MAGPAEPTVERPRLAYWLGTFPGRTLAVISSVLLFALMAVTFIDVGGRYLFNSPLPAAHEMISYTMPAILFCALPLVCRREGHVTIDLLDPLFPKRWRRAQGLIVNFVSFATVLFIAWRLMAKALDHWEFDEATDELYMSIWPFSAGSAVLCVVAAVALFANVLGYALGNQVHPADKPVGDT